ncbi:MAG: class I SAM-dependent methyltransferase [Pseudonocardiaceae bacterium]
MDKASYKATIKKAFNRLATTYDKSGVEFFTPAGKRLVELVAPQPGGRVLDLGCGRGACLFPAAHAVGSTGYLIGIDTAPAMIEEARREAERLGLGNVELLVMDAEQPQFPPIAFDFITGGFIIVFLPDPISALTSFRKLLTPGGKLGFTSPLFHREWGLLLPPLTEVITDEILQYVPEEWRPHNLVEHRYSWLVDTDELIATLTQAGFDNIIIHDEPVRIVTGSGRDWVTWSQTHGIRLLWDSLPEHARRQLETSIIAELESRRADDGLIATEMPVRYVIAEAAAWPITTRRNGTQD